MSKRNSRPRAKAPPMYGAADTEITGQTDGGGQAQPDQTAPPPPSQAPTTLPSIFDQAVAFSGEQKANKCAAKLWETSGCDLLPPKIAVAVYDCALRQGEKACAGLLGKIGLSRQDGEFDASALAKVAKHEHAALINFLSWRLRRYAFTANAATSMVEWSQHILALQSFILIDLKT